MKKQSGYTLSELLICVFGVGVLVLVGFALYDAVHFILKFW